jgi:hypothetical protein
MAKNKNQAQEPTTKRTRGKRSTGTSSQQPPSPPQPQPPIQPPYQRFVSEIAEERYNLIKKRGFNKERGIAMDKLTKHPVFVWQIEARKWEGIVNMVTEESNASIALEFLANAFVQKNGYTYVRGKKVSYCKRNIQRVLGLRDVEKCDVEYRKQVYGTFRSRSDWDGLLEGLMRDGKGWIGPVVRPQRINTVDLLPEYKAWASFILTVIEQTSSTAEMIRDRVIILLAMIADDEIDVAGLMTDSLWKLISTDKNTLGHCCLINRLCQEAQVPVEPTDVYVRSLRPISDPVLEGFEKEQEAYDRKFREAEEHQAMEQDHIPQVPPQQVPLPQMQQQGLPPYFMEYTYAMANWAQDISSRDRMPPPAFPQPFYEAAERYRQTPVARTNAYDRFASPLEMENYFAEERQRGLRAEERIRAEYFRIQAERNPGAESQPLYYPFPPSGPGGSSGARQ